MHLIVILAIVCFAMPTFAQDDSNASEKADAHYQSAMQLYSEGRYRESIEAFDAAIALVPESVFFCNRAAVQLELSDVEKALTDLTTCRDKFDGAPEDAAIINAQVLAAELTVNRVGPSARNTTSAVSRAILESNTEQRFGLRGWGLVTLAVGGGAIASAVIFDLLSAQLVEDFVRESEGRTGTSEERFEELKSQVQTRQVVFYTLAISGAVLSTAGLGMIVFGGPKDKGPSAGIRINPTNITVYGTF